MVGFRVPGFRRPVDTRALRVFSQKYQACLHCCHFGFKWDADRFHKDYPEDPIADLLEAARGRANVFL